MRKELITLRQLMSENHIDAYMIPTTDFHGSEYVNDYFKCRRFISGFTGSEGTLVVTADEAKLWTDGRYFLQASKQLSGSGIKLMKMGQEGVPTIEEYLQNTLKEGQCLGFDGRVIDCAFGRSLEKDFGEKGIKLSYEKDLINEFWTKRPKIDPSKVYELPLSVTGISPENKMASLRKVMEEKGAKYHLITKLEEIAWLFNLRGADVENTPVFYAYALIEEKHARLYLMDTTFDREWKKDLVEIKPYYGIFEDMAALDKKASILMDEAIVNYALVKTLPGGISIINEKNPCEMMKAIKNPIEIESTKRAHIKDGVAMVNFIYWLKKNIGKIPMSEISASDYLETCRQQQDGLFDLSFPTIAGYNEHGAIVHYSATARTNKDLAPEGFLLVDSGGQYNDGTTDITRTIALGPLSDKMKSYYTGVLKSNVTLATTEFKPGTYDTALDVIARKPLKAMGLDFNHGTGHGVGHILSVHEDPNNISPRFGDCPILPGMITTDEPGVYIEGEFGIRIENELLCTENKDGLYEFESITLCPFEREAIIVSDLAFWQIDYINEYHRLVYNTLAPFLDEHVSKWLHDVTAPLE